MKTALLVQHVEESNVKRCMCRSHAQTDAMHTACPRPRAFSHRALPQKKGVRWALARFAPCQHLAQCWSVSEQQEPREQLLEHAAAGAAVLSLAVAWARYLLAHCWHLVLRCVWSGTTSGLLAGWARASAWGLVWQVLVLWDFQGGPLSLLKAEQAEQQWSGLLAGMLRLKVLVSALLSSSQP